LNVLAQRLKARDVLGPDRLLGRDQRRNLQDLGPHRLAQGPAFRDQLRQTGRAFGNQLLKACLIRLRVVQREQAFPYQFLSCVADGPNLRFCGPRCRDLLTNFGEIAITAG
jgi:hypothetical protein